MMNGWQRSLWVLATLGGNYTPPNIMILRRRELSPSLGDAQPHQDEAFTPQHYTDLRGSWGVHEQMKMKMIDVCQTVELVVLQLQSGKLGHQVLLDGGQNALIVRIWVVWAGMVIWAGLRASNLVRVWW